MLAHFNVFFLGYYIVPEDKTFTVHGQLWNEPGFKPLKEALEFIENYSTAYPIQNCFWCFAKNINGASCKKCHGYEI